MGDEFTNTEVLWLLAFLTAKSDEESTRCVDALIGDILMVHMIAFLYITIHVVQFSQNKLTQEYFCLSGNSRRAARVQCRIPFCHPVDQSARKFVEWLEFF